MSTPVPPKTDDVISNDVMITALRQLIGSLEPFIRETATAEQAEEAVIRLEENDKRFHKYDLVRLVRSRMEEKLGTLVEVEIDRHTAGHATTTMGQDTLVEKIVDKVVNSQQYSDVMKTLKNSATDCLDQLAQNFDDEFGIGAASHANEMGNVHVKNVYSFSDDESSFGSSLNQSSFMFMNQEQFNQIAENLEKKKSLSVRRQALKSLSQIPPMDIQGSEQWSLLRKGILDALSDADEQLYSMGLNFCAKGFSSSSHHTREIYSTLVEHLMLQFNSRKSSIPKLQSGLNVNEPDIIRVLQAVRLLHDFQVRIPAYWVRQSPKFLDEILESTLRLLSIRNVGGSSQIAPIHLLSLLDPKASWFVKWMHGNYSRQPLLTMLKKYRAIVDAATRHCLCYVRSRLVDKDWAPAAPSPVREHVGDGGRIYTAEELDCAYFVHSITMIGKLLAFKDGRSFFPIKVKDEPMTISKFLVTVIGLVHQAVPGTGKQAMLLYDPVVLTVDLLKKQCVAEQSLDVCLCQDDVISVLLAPLSEWLAGSLPDVKDIALLYIADIMSAVAASSRGRVHILYGRGKNMFSAEDTSAAHVIARFTRLALEEHLPDQNPSFPSRAVIGAFMYTCRQLYSDCEGLMVMEKHEIYQVISSAWREACREADQAATPTPSEHNHPVTPTPRKESQNLLLWEDTLRDNLLNFAGTPKGVLLLQLTGAMDDCVSYMYTRYTKKLQVSKCEKFGYGFMLTQIAAASPGMVALQNTGFMEALIAELWYLLEGGSDETPATPKTWPLQPVDRSVHKPMVSLLNLLSAFPAVYELLAKQSLPEKKQYTLREAPTNLVDLLDRLVIVNTSAKFDALFNYEQSHAFGLRLLSVMTSCLDTCLLLETQYKFTAFLLNSQLENISGEDKSQDIIIDMLSLERNYILVKTHVIGGPTEKVLPPRQLSEDKSNPYPYPLFGKYPLPQEYATIQTANVALKPENELGKFLAESKKSEHNAAWLDKCKKAFCGVLSTKPEQATVAVIQEMLERAVPILVQNKEEAFLPLASYSANDATVKGVKLSAITNLGIQYTIRYGSHLKLLNSDGQALEKLTTLMKHVTHFLQLHRKVPQTQYKYLDEEYHAHDWFASTVFLMMNGNRERTWKLLYKMTTLVASAFLWPARAHLSTHMREDLSQCGIKPIFFSTGHGVELILQAEVSSVFSAFRMSGYTPSQICQHWLRQCLWNYLDWLDICHYICVCLLLGVDYQEHCPLHLILGEFLSVKKSPKAVLAATFIRTYFLFGGAEVAVVLLAQTKCHQHLIIAPVYTCVALLKHLQSGILSHMQSQDLMIFLKEEAIPGFRLGQHLEYMQQLETKYRKIILPSMINIAKT